MFRIDSRSSLFDYFHCWVCWVWEREQACFWFGLLKTSILFKIAVTEFDMHMSINIICVILGLGVRGRIILNFSLENKLW
jgi:hypothetical protein